MGSWKVTNWATSSAASASADQRPEQARAGEQHQRAARNGAGQERPEPCAQANKRVTHPRIIAPIATYA